jgi:hypothetical protein
VSPLAPTPGTLRARAAQRSSPFPSTGASGELFAGKPLPRRNPVTKRNLAPELTAARVLCNQLRRKRASAEKKRIVHLICLNLLAVLNRPSQQG